ncbi:MBL fold metallo-hydrolase [Thiomicrospira sp. WB1]|uniref:MBL fold metallo-hydrolase n=1 Tax=Thiomicrospira sp. WB1 TaxID=1685380 RepID=UPI000A7EB7B4|nr:MBL fold metallo-hydrolase [Thiomicrospira sp. WB1]
MKSVLLLLFTLSLSVQAWAGQGKDLFAAEKVTDGVYAYVGPIDDRSPENLGLNNNIGFIDTSEGWVLVDSGGGDAAARKIEAMAKAIKDQPITAVINIGSQDHRWLGNDYFARQGATIYAFEGTVKTQKRMYDNVTNRMFSAVPANKGAKQKTADKVLQGNKNTLTIGGVAMRLNFYGDAHFPGDAVLWLPDQKVLFTGDIVYLDRMLGVHPWSDPMAWHEAYQAMRNLPASYIVPGHGQVAEGWDRVDRDTGNYLKKLTQTMYDAADAFMGVGAAVSDNKDWPEFQHLKHYDSWHSTNLNRTYLKLESSM